MFRGTPSAWWASFTRFFRGRTKEPTRLIIFPAGSHSPREVRIPGWVRRAVVIAGVVLLFPLAHYSWLVLAPNGGSESVIEERDALRQLNRGHAQDTERMAEEIEAIETQMRRLAMLAGADPIPARTGGLGGPVGTPAGYDFVSERLEDLSGRIANLDRQGLALERSMRDKNELIASTPSIWPVRGYLSSGFGRRNDPFTGEIEHHAGIDISAAVGTPVRVTADGLVIEAGTSSTYGKNVLVNHGFGKVTRYAHLSSIEVRRNQRLRRGQIVGRLGNTGRSRAPHLHYEVWVNERAQNPLDHIVDYSP